MGKKELLNDSQLGIRLSSRTREMRVTTRETIQRRYDQS